MSVKNHELFIVAGEVAREWPYPTSHDFLEIDFNAQLAIVRRMTTDGRAKAGWEKLSKYAEQINDKKWFCRSVLREVITICCSYAISRREGVIDRKERFEKISNSLDFLERNFEIDGEFFRESRLAINEKNSTFVDELSRAMEPHLKRLTEPPFAQANSDKYNLSHTLADVIGHILCGELFKLLEDNPYSLLNTLKPVVTKLAAEPPLTTKMNLDDANEIYFQKCMTAFWCENLDRPLYGVTADFSNALFDVAITENKVRDRVKKK